MRRLLGFVRCAFALLAVSTALLSASDDSKEPKWIEIHGTHFSIVSDASDKKTREATLRLEQMRALFALLLQKTRLNMSSPVTVIGVRNDAEYRALAPGSGPDYAPAFLLRDPDRTLIVLNLSADQPWRAIAHPLAHYFLDFNYPPAPSWFDEGFADYFAAAQFDNKQINLGGDPRLTPDFNEDVLGGVGLASGSQRSATSLLSASAWIPIVDLFKFKHQSTGNDGDQHTLFHAESWMVMHYLLKQGKLPETGTFFDLVKNQQVPVEEAIQKAYGMSAAEFETAVKDYFHALKPLFAAEEEAHLPSSAQDPRLAAQLSSTPAPVGTDEATAMTLNTVATLEAQAMLADALTRIPEHADQGVRELNALAAAPQDNEAARRSLAWAHLQRNEFDAAAEQLSRAAELNPRDPWIRYYLSALKYRMAEKAHQPIQGLANMLLDLRATLDVFPEFAEAYNMLGMGRVEGGGANAALEAQRAAVALSPRRDDYQFNLAQIYLAGKKWDAAHAIFERLTRSSNLPVATAAKQQLQDFDSIKKYGVAPLHNGGAQTSGKTKSASEQLPKTLPEEPVETLAPAPAPSPRLGPIQFARGKLLSSDCSHPPDAILTIATSAKTLRLHTPDFKALIVIGADEFSCDWKNKAVSANYRSQTVGLAELVSLEVQ